MAYESSFIDPVCAGLSLTKSIISGLEHLPEILMNLETYPVTAEDPGQLSYTVHQAGEAEVSYYVTDETLTKVCSRSILPAVYCNRVQTPRDHNHNFIANRASLATVDTVDIVPSI